MREERVLSLRRACVWPHDAEQMGGQGLMWIHPRGLHLKVEAARCAQLFFEQRDLLQVEIRCDGKGQGQLARVMQLEVGAIEREGRAQPPANLKCLVAHDRKARELALPFPIATNLN